MSEPTVDEFYQRATRRAGRVGWTDWMRSLPYDTPTAVPEEILKKTRSLDIQSAIRGVAQSAGVSVRTRERDGRVWVLRVQS